MSSFLVLMGTLLIERHSFQTPISQVLMWREGTIIIDSLLFVRQTWVTTRECWDSSRLPNQLPSFPRQKLKLGPGRKVVLHRDVYFQSCFLLSNVPQAFTHSHMAPMCVCALHSVDHNKCRRDIERTKQRTRNVLFHHSTWKLMNYWSLIKWTIKLKMFCTAAPPRH